MDYLSPEGLVDLANAKMPFGKYGGRYLLEIPEAYYGWFQKKGFPEGEIGLKLRAMHEIKINGLEYLLKPLLKR
jgi:uncharacterized protein